MPALATAAALAALAAVLPAQAQARHSSCYSTAHSATVLDQSNRAIVFARGQTVYGCYFGRSRIWRLPRQGRATRENPGRYSIQQEPLAVTGRYAAYVTRFFSDAGSGRGPLEATGQVIVFDLVTGRPYARSAETGTESTLGSIVLEPNGSVAWIWSVRSGFTAPTSVRKLDRSGPGDQTLDHYDPMRGGDAIHRGSLALSADRTRIYWSTDAGVRTAELR